MQKKFTFFLFISVAIIAVMGLHFSALAQEATSTSADGEQAIGTTTPPAPEPVADTSSSTPAVESAPEPPPPPPPSPEPAPAPEPPPPPPPSAAKLQPKPAPQPAPEPMPEPIRSQSNPIPPGVTPVVPFESKDGKAFDPATAPSKVRLKILNPDGSVPAVPVFVSFVGVGGRTYGGPIDREGAIETVMPTGRYYTDILVIDTKFGPPANPPSFFLEANEERDFGVLLLSDKSSFTDSNLEREVAASFDGHGGGGLIKGLARSFALIIKLLLQILQEIRSLRSELLSR